MRWQVRGIYARAPKKGYLLKDAADATSSFMGSEAGTAAGSADSFVRPAGSGAHPSAQTRTLGLGYREV